MDKWDKTVERFRALGGVIENVKMAEGKYGRGLFPQNEKLPVKISIPNRLLLPAEWLQFDLHGKLILSKDCNWDDEAKEFYLDYQHNYGLTDNLVQKMMQYQSQVIALPSSIKNMLMAYGMDKLIFSEPSPQLCLEMYKRSRRIFTADRKLVLMPMIELVNHDENSKKTFEKVPQIGISGKFNGEILVHYGMTGDASLMFEVYGFSAPKEHSFSGALSINIGNKTITIARYINIYNTVGKTFIPKLKLEGNIIHLSYLVLGSVNDRSSPKKIFRKLMHSVGMPPNMAEEIFDGLLEQNKNFFLRILEEIKHLEGDVVNNIRAMAINQLIPLGVRV